MDTPNQEPRTVNTEPEKEQPKTEPKPQAEPQVVKEVHHHHYKRGFNPGSMFFGLLIIVVGVAFLGRNAGWFDFSFQVDWNVIWPVILILVGLSFFNRRGWVSGVIGGVITVIVVGLVAWAVFGGTAHRETTTDTVTILKQDKVAESVVNIKTGAGKLAINGSIPVSSTSLITGTHTTNNLSLTKESSLNGTTQTTTLSTKSSGSWVFNHRNELSLQLAKDIPTSLILDTGAMDMTLDLTEIQAKLVDVDTGASTLNLTLGDLLETAEVRVDAGASTINVTLPKTLGAKLSLDSGATSKNLADFTKIDEHTYESTNYSTSTKKVTLDFDLGAATLDIRWK